MIIKSEVMGEIEYHEEDIFYFPDGLYGFKTYTKFLIISVNEPDLPFYWLQSIEDENLSFVLTNPFLFTEEYEFNLPESVTELLELESLDQLLIYSLVVIHEEMELSTINLKAPLVINRNTHKCKQVILNEEFPYKHFLFKK